MHHPTSLRGTEEKPIPVLHSEAVAELLTDGASTEYLLNAHHRHISRVDASAWSALPRGGGARSSDVPKLRSLDLSFNAIEGFSVHLLAPLKELRELKLYANRIGDAGLESVGLDKLSKLERLELHDNNLTQPPDAVDKLPKLKVLRLERNRLEKISGLAKCTGLEHLSLDRNDLATLQGLGACQNLEYLSAGDNQIDALPPRTLQTCRKLRELSLGRNALSDPALKGLAPLANCLATLRLQSNSLTSLMSMPLLKQLVELHLASNRLCNGSLTNLHKAAPMLEVLDISNNRIDDLEEIKAPLTKVTELRELSVMGNPCCPDDRGARTMSGWWATLREELVMLHFLDDDPTGRFDSAAIDPSIRPTTPASARARPPSSLGRPGTAGSSRPGTTEGGRPVMRPPSNRTAYGSDFKLEPLDDIQARADDFRRQLGNVKGEMMDAAMGKWDAQSRRPPVAFAPVLPPPPKDDSAIVVAETADYERIEAADDGERGGRLAISSSGFSAATPAAPPSPGTGAGAGSAAEWGARTGAGNNGGGGHNRKSKLDQALGFGKRHNAPKGSAAEDNAEDKASPAKFFLTEKPLSSPSGDIAPGRGKRGVLAYNERVDMDDGTDVAEAKSDARGGINGLFGPLAGSLTESKLSPNERAPAPRISKPWRTATATATAPAATGPATSSPPGASKSPLSRSPRGPSSSRSGRGTQGSPSGGGGKPRASPVRPSPTKSVPPKGEAKRVDESDSDSDEEDVGAKSAPVSLDPRWTSHERSTYDNDDGAEFEPTDPVVEGDTALKLRVEAANANAETHGDRDAHPLTLDNGLGALEMPTPSPRFEPVKTTKYKPANTVAGRAGAPGKKKGLGKFKIPAKAKEALALSDSTNTTP